MEPHDKSQEERVDVSLLSFGRWVAIAAFMLIGLGFFFWLAPETRQVIVPVVETS